MYSKHNCNGCVSYFWQFHRLERNKYYTKTINECLN